jgi:hypothetical protein
MNTDGSVTLTTGKKQTKRIIPYALISEIRGRIIFLRGRRASA